MIQQIPFCNTNDHISQISLGTMWFGSAFDENLSYRILDTFVEAGGNALDTANCYSWWSGPQYVGDESENLIGKWMKERKNRQEIFLASKMGARPNKPARLWDKQGNARWDIVKEEFQYLAPVTIRKEIENSLRRLQSDVLDLYFVHLDDPVTPIEETLYAMHQLVIEGKVRYIGCSNFSTERVKLAHQISEQNGWNKYIAIQQEYTYFEPKPDVDLGGETQHADHKLIEYIQHSTEFALFAYSPLLKGIYDDKQKREQFYNWHAFNTPKNNKRLHRLTEVSTELEISNNQLVLAWLLRQPRLIPILGASSPEQLKKNLEVLDVPLTNKHLTFLNELS